MNIRTILCAILFSIINCTVVQAQRPDISGGIVYSNGKDAIYMDFSSGKEFNLTSDDNRIIFAPPFVISDNGKKLLWLQAGRFCMKDLPVGPPQAVRALIMKPTKDGGASGKDQTYEDIIWQGEVKNLSISPDGVRFAYDANYIAPGWIMLDSGNPQSFQKMMEAGLYRNFGSSNITPNDPRFLALPLWVKRNDSFNGIAYLSTKFNVYNPNPGGNNPLLPIFGSTIKWPPSPLFKATFQDVSGGQINPGVIQLPLGHGLVGWWQYGGELDQGQTVAPPTINFSRCVKKNAHFLTFQKNQAWQEGWKKAAFIYQIGDQWGPIEIQTLDGVKQSDIDYAVLGKSPYFPAKQVPPEYKEKKSRWIEIQTVFPEVTGLAWKPDGSLSVFTKQGTVFLITGEEIRNAFSNSVSRLVKDTLVSSDVRVISEKNFFRSTPKIIAQEIKGTCFYWVSNQQLLYLDENKNICLWNQGIIEKIAKPTDYFSYCSVSPFSNVTNMGFIAEKNNEFPSPISGVATTPEGGVVEVNAGPSPQDALISFGKIQTIWLDNFRETSVTIPLKIKTKSFDLGPFKFTLLENEKDLNNIDDPSKYDYFSSQERKIIVVKNSVMLQRQIKQLERGQTVTGNIETDLEAAKMDHVIVPIGSIIILYHNESYLALKPISLELKYKTIKEVPEWAKHKNSWGDYIAKGKVPPIHSLMHYEWKYWPKAPAPKNIDPIDPKKEQYWNIGTAPFGKEFEISEVKFTWERLDNSNREDPSTKFKISFIIGERDLNNIVEWAVENTKIHISDPSKYEFSKITTITGPSLRGRKLDWTWSSRHTFILKLGNKYIAIEPIEEKQGWIKYKWQYWPSQKDPDSKIGTQPTQ